MIMKYSLLILSAILLVSSCTEIEENQTITREAKLRDGFWKMESGMTRNRFHNEDDGQMLTDEKNIEKPECREDDYFVFRELYEGAHIPGEMTCSINETAELQFTWGLTNNDSGIFIYDADEFFGADVNAEFIEFYDDKFGIRFVQYTDKLLVIDGNPGTFVQDTLTTTMYFIKTEPEAEGDQQ